jgi:hypothetical protein
VDSCADDDYDRYDPDQLPVVTSKLSFSNGKNGNSGQTQGNCGFDRGHWAKRDGHSGHCHPGSAPTILVNAEADRVGERITFADPGSELAYWTDVFEERATTREHDGGYPRADAERLAWREVEWRWHMAHCKPAAPDICAGCRQPIGAGPQISLIDGNAVHDRHDHACLIRFGEYWRGVARASLIALGLPQPAALQ